MITVIVNSQHILDGQKDNHSHNPLALASHKFDRFAVVTKTHVHLCQGVYALPRHMIDWLDRYNEGKQMMPVSFVLE